MITEESMENLVRKINCFKKGEKITLVLENIFKEEILLKATYMGEIKPFGFTSADGGSWGLFQTGSTTIKCYNILIKFYKKKNNQYITLGHSVKDIVKGWDINRDEI